MNALVRMRNSHARRFEPGWKLSHATIARSSVSWTRSFAVSGSRQMRIATPNISAWCGRHASSNAWCGFSFASTARSARRGATVARRVIRVREGTLDLLDREVCDMPPSKAADMPSATSRIESVFSSARLARHEARLKADARSSEESGGIFHDIVVGSGPAFGVVVVVEWCIYKLDEDAP